ncbi:MAG: hypothetical protein IKO32_09855 [Lachnospiraceae bacterium]|nr:hypothetical protein [Lachnospiraceae bacterium]
MSKEKKEFKFTVKNCRIFAIICFAVSVLCLIGFGISGIANRSSSAERFLNKYETICQTADRAKLRKLYVKDAVLPDEYEMDVPYEGKNPEYLYEGIEKIGDREYKLSYTVYYELSQNITVDGKETTKTTSFTETGKELYLHRNFTGFKMREEAAR